MASLGGAAAVDGEPWRIPIGMRESDLGVAELVLYESEHAIVAGPARSGKSQTLWTVAEALAGTGVHIAAIAGRRSPLHDCPLLDRVASPGGDATAMLAMLRAQAGPVVVLIDDADGIDDVDGAVAGLLGARPDLHVVAAARADSLRSLYGHWTQEVRKSKVGVLLRPSIDYDGDLVGATLPRRAPVQMGVGRGYLAHNGELDIVQVAQPVLMSQAVAARCLDAMTRIPPTEITGLFGAMVKRFAKKKLGEVPESLGVMWHNRAVLKTLHRVLRARPRSGTRATSQLKSFAHMAAVSLGRLQLLPGLRLLRGPQRRARHGQGARGAALARVDRVHAARARRAGVRRGDDRRRRRR